MDQRIFYGDLEPIDIANRLVSEFNQGNLKTQIVGKKNNLSVQISTSRMSRSGGPTALSINIRQVPDGVMIQVGEQEWLGTAASMGQSALATILNPANLLWRLDDIAQDISNFQLTDRVWKSVENAIKQTGASTLLSDKLSRLTCEYCLSANEVGSANCVACGAPLGEVHPISCPKCGWVNKKSDENCSKCGSRL
jgi:hypothetical protein